VNEAVDEDRGNRISLYPGGNTGNNVGSYQGDTIRNITGAVGGTEGNPIVEGAFYNTNRRYDMGASGGGDYLVGFDASLVVPTGADNRPKNAYVYYIIRAK